jgi:hypothetical protein
MICESNKRKSMYRHIAKITCGLVALAFLFAATQTTRSADPAAKPRATGSVRLTLVFKSNTTLNLTFDSGNIVNVQSDFEHVSSSPVKHYSYEGKNGNGSITVDLRELAAAVIER